MAQEAQHETEQNGRILKNGHGSKVGSRARTNPRFHPAAKIGSPSLPPPPARPVTSRNAAQVILQIMTGFILVVFTLASTRSRRPPAVALGHGTGLRAGPPHLPGANPRGGDGATGWLPWGWHWPSLPPAPPATGVNTDSTSPPSSRQPVSTSTPNKRTETIEIRENE